MKKYKNWKFYLICIFENIKQHYGFIVKQNFKIKTVFKLNMKIRNKSREYENKQIPKSFVHGFIWRLETNRRVIVYQETTKMIINCVK